MVDLQELNDVSAGAYPSPTPGAGHQNGQVARRGATKTAASGQGYGVSIGNLPGDQHRTTIRMGSGVDERGPVMSTGQGGVRLRAGNFRTIPRGLPVRRCIPKAKLPER